MLIDPIMVVPLFGSGNNGQEKNNNSIGTKTRLVKCKRVITETLKQDWLGSPVASNHSNLYITLIALVLRALRITHAKVNGTEKGKGRK